MLIEFSDVFVMGFLTFFNVCRVAPIELFFRRICVAIFRKRCGAGVRHAPVNHFEYQLCGTYISLLPIFFENFYNILQRFLPVLLY